MLKKFLIYSLCSAPIIAGTVALPIVLTNEFENTNKIQNFFSSFNDPYKELEMFATTLDIAYNTNNQYLSKAKIVNESLKNFIKEASNLINNKNNPQTVMFIKNDGLFFNNDDNSKLLVNQFWAEQPILFPQIYSKSNDQNTPGLGYYFPAPINKNSNSLFDDWFEIGASSFDSAYNKFTISQRIVTSWENTCDYVFYLYDSNHIGDEQAFNDYIYNTTNSNLWAYKLLKKDAKIKHVIPLDMQWFYFGIWDQVGNFIFMYLISNILLSNDPSICIDMNLNNWNSIPWNENIKNKASSLPWTPKKVNLQPIAPTTGGEKTNFLATLYNLVGHSFSLGIKPNYIMKFNENNNDEKYNWLCGYESWYMDQFSLNDFVDQNTLSTISSIKKLNLYAIATNRDIAGDSGIWPIENTPSLLHDTTPSEISNIIAQLNIKCVYSERNDTIYTQTEHNQKIVYDTLNNLEYSVNEWVNKNE